MSDVYNFGMQIADFLRGVLGTEKKLPEPPPPDQTPKHFPPAGIDFIQHELRVRLNFGQTSEEIVTLYGAMLVQRDEPRTGRDGRREIPFKVLSWSASGWCYTIGATFTYVLTANVEQPTSYIVAEQDDSDYPASFLFNVTFDTRVDNMTVYTNLEGAPEGPHYLVVPPTGDRRLAPTITTFKDKGRVSVKHPAFGEIVATPVDCNDKSGRTVITIPGLRRIADSPRPPEPKPSEGKPPEGKT